jgi:beta-lactamase class A
MKRFALASMIFSLGLATLAPASAEAKPRKYKSTMKKSRAAKPVMQSQILPQSDLPVYFKNRLLQIVPLIKGQVQPVNFFTPSFMQAVSAVQFTELAASVIQQHGQPLSIIQIERKSDTSAIIKLEFEKSIATIKIAADAVAPHKVSGMLITDFTAKNDSLAKIAADFGALPGASGYILAEISDDGSVKTLAAQNPDRQFAIGSTFKLYILAELAHQVSTGQRKWSDVAPLSDRSFSSKGTNKWPVNSPVTLHSLASWMISVSDNSATDTLLRLLGREAVERRLASIGHSNPDKTLPFLSTVEAFALKANPPLRARFMASSESQQRDLLEAERAALAFDKIDSQTFNGGPVAIDSIEWFASPADLGNLMRHIRVQRNDQLMSILAINPGIPAETAAKWSYLGYKGGSENGVISMTWLGKSKSGKWIVATGSWNNTAISVDEDKFGALMARLLDSATQN